MADRSIPPPNERPVEPRDVPMPVDHARVMVTGVPVHVWPGADISIPFETGVAMERAVAIAIARHVAAGPHAFRRLRRALDLSAAQLGDLIGRRAEAISTWENGHVPIDAAAYQWLCLAVEASLCGLGKRRALEMAAAARVSDGTVRVAFEAPHATEVST